MDNISSNVLNFLAKSKLNYGYDYGSSGAGAGFLAFFFWFLIMIGFYVYSSLALMLIAKKTNTPNAWMAWVPILNLYLLCRVAGKSMIWFIMFFFPFINIVAMVVIWSAVSERRGKPAWWGILMLLPIVNLVIPGILAFSGASRKPVAASSPEPAGAKPSIAKQGNFCPNCGAKIKASDKFCPECGKPAK